MEKLSLQLRFALALLLGVGLAGAAPPAAPASTVAIGDLNGDGKLDLAVTNLSTAVTVLLGNGDGSFGARIDYGAGNSPNSAAISDLNGDGRLDLAVSNQGSNSVSVLLGNGDGTFAAKTDYATGVQPLCVA